MCGVGGGGVRRGLGRGGTAQAELSVRLAKIRGAGTPCMHHRRCNMTERATSVQGCILRVIPRAHPTRRAAARWPPPGSRRSCGSACRWRSGRRAPCCTVGGQGIVDAWEREAGAMRSGAEARDSRPGRGEARLAACGARQGCPAWRGQPPCTRISHHFAGSPRKEGQCMASQLAPPYYDTPAA